MMVVSSIESTERSVSLWEATVAPIEFPALQSDITADVCVIGAGIAGLTAAYLLARKGRSVVVLDRAAVGGGETGQTTAHLASAMDDFFHVIAAMHGPRGASLARESHATAIDRIGCIIRWNPLETSWDCPCHGSRFAPTGEVLTGPAIHPLQRLDPSPFA